MEPFQRGYIVEAVIRAQTMCGSLGRNLLRRRIQREYLTFAGVTEDPGEIFLKTTEQVLKRLPDRRVWKLLQKWDIIDGRFEGSLEKYTQFRDDLAHDVMKPFQYMVDGAKKAEVQQKLQRMTENILTLVDILKG